MYRRLVVTYCGDIYLEKYSSILLKSKEVLIKTSYTYLSVADIALNNCELVAKGRKVLGSIAVGKVIDIGVAVNDVISGSRAVIFAINSVDYLDTFGCAQDLFSVEKDFIKIVKLSEYNDKELLILAILSVDKDILEVLKGGDILLIGEDISILSFAHYAKRYSCRVGIVPQFTLHLLNTIGTEHISIYNSPKNFDVIVLATHDPLLMCLTVKKFAKDRGSKVIVYPHMYKSMAFSCINSSNISIETVGFGDIEVGIEIFDTYRDSISKLFKVFEVNNVPMKNSNPLIVKHV
jgi:hypothetical protein